jgi:hypothetical protein
VVGSGLSFVRVAGQEPFLDVLYYGASEFGCSGCVFEVLRKLSDELVTPSCPRVVQVRYGLGLNALRADISRSAASAFLNANW